MYGMMFLVNRLVRRSQDDLQQWITAERRSFFMGNEGTYSRANQRFAY